MTQPSETSNSHVLPKQDVFTAAGLGFQSLEVAAQSDVAHFESGALPRALDSTAAAAVVAAPAVARAAVEQTEDLGFQSLEFVQVHCVFYAFHGGCVDKWDRPPLWSTATFPNTLSETHVGDNPTLVLKMEMHHKVDKEHHLQQPFPPYKWNTLRFPDQVHKAPVQPSPWPRMSFAHFATLEKTVAAQAAQPAMHSMPTPPQPHRSGAGESTVRWHGGCAAHDTRPDPAHAGRWPMGWHVQPSALH